MKNHFAAFVSLGLSILAAAVLWGASQQQIKTQGQDIKELKDFQNQTVDRMARVETTVNSMNSKLDIILRSHR